MPSSGTVVHNGKLVSDEYLMSVANLGEHGVFEPPKTDVSAFLDDILLRADRLMAGGSPEVRESARHLHAYAALSRQVYEQYLEAGRAQ